VGLGLSVTTVQEHQVVQEVVLKVDNQIVTLLKDREILHQQVHHKEMMEVYIQV
jgi:hypothetical protein